METPEIKSRLEKEKNKPKIIKQKKKHKKQKASSKPAPKNEIIYIISEGLIKNVNPDGISVEPYKEPTTGDWVMNERKAEGQDYGGAK